MATFYPTIRIRGDSPRFLNPHIWECLIWGNRKSRQLMRHSKLWKNIKSSETFYWSASWRSSGLAEIQTGTWGGWALMMIMWRSAFANCHSSQHPVRQPFISLFWSCGHWPAKVGSLLGRQMYVGGPTKDYPNGFAASGQKKKRCCNKNLFIGQDWRVNWYYDKT